MEKVEHRACVEEVEVEHRACGGEVEDRACTFWVTALISILYCQ